MAKNANVLIGANGAGKSSFVSTFRMLGDMVDLRLQKWTALQGGADRAECTLFDGWLSSLEQLSDVQRTQADG